MSAITWRNVEAPDFNAASRMMDRSADSFDKALSTFDNIAQNQRNMNLFEQGAERESNIQSGKEAILDGSATLDDWKNLNLDNTLAPYQDTKTRAALMDFYNQRDDMLREETKADLSIDQANQSMRLAEAQNKRAIAEDGRQRIRLGIAQKQAANQQRAYDQQQDDYFKGKADEVQVDGAAQLINSMVAQNAPADDIQKAIEQHVAAKNPDGTPVFSNTVATKIKALAAQGIVEVNTLTSNEKDQLALKTEEIQTKYNKAGIGHQTDKAGKPIKDADGKLIPTAGLNVLNYSIENADAIISKFDNTEKTVLENAKGFQDRNAFLANQLAVAPDDSSGNLKDLKTEVNDRVIAVNDLVTKNIYESLTTGEDAITHAAAERFLKDNRINEALIISALSATTATEDWMGEDYDINNLAPFSQKLELDANRYIMDKFRAEQAKNNKKVWENQKTKINSEQVKEVASFTKLLREAKTNKDIIMGK